LFFWLDKKLATGSWLDMGMFLQNVMLTARGLGLETCPQAALSDYPDTVRQHLGIADEQLLVCGMAVGYKNSEDKINQYRTEREPLDVFCQWYD
jgi:nitroreductase